MKQSQCVAAYIALSKIMEQDTSLLTARKVFGMVHLLQPCWDFQGQQERKIIERHPDVDPRNSSVTCPTDDKEEADRLLAELDSYTKELEELGQMEQNLKIEPFSIPLSENIKIAGKDIKALEGFVTFE